ncbi:MAG: V-type ATP synthase subunit E family protein [Niameybacter sp.]|uniref:V-type ATP synthase subunit E n=1 Tax=Niameybacter sp. TaxID=2033640 RepID=UPI002FC75087
MVTIEQKLSLFSKLLQQDIKTEIGDKIESMEKEYEEIMLEHKRKVDKDADDIVEHARKKGEIKRLELISKAKMQTKKQTMFTKEKYIGVFMEHLKARIGVFKRTTEYKAYLTYITSKVEDLQSYHTDFVVYMTQEDHTQYGDYILEQLTSTGVAKERLSLAVRDDSMLGGIVLDSPVKNLRIDLSIAAVIEDHRDEIVEQLFQAIGEVGGLDE